MGTAEIAERLGVTRQRAYQISRQKGFPDSFDDLTAGSFWLREDVERWIAAHWKDRLDPQAPDEL